GNGERATSDGPPKDVALTDAAVAPEPHRTGTVTVPPGATVDGFTVTWAWAAAKPGATSTAAARPSAAPTAALLMTLLMVPSIPVKSSRPTGTRNQLVRAIL